MISIKLRPEIGQSLSYCNNYHAIYLRHGWSPLVCGASRLAFRVEQVDFGQLLLTLIFSAIGRSIFRHLDMELQAMMIEVRRCWMPQHPQEAI